MSESIKYSIKALKQLPTIMLGVGIGFAILYVIFGEDIDIMEFKENYPEIIDQRIAEMEKLV